MTPDKATQLGNDLCCLAASIAEIGEELKALYDFDGQDRMGDSAQSEPTSEATPKPVRAESASEVTNVPTLIEVRTLLAEKSRLGYQDAVKALITKRGAERLSEIDPAEYLALMKGAEALK